MNDIKLKEFDVTYQSSKVVCDFKELDKSIEEIEKRYKNLVVSDEELKEAKKLATELNKCANKLNDKKKEIKNEINKESKAFEKECMERVNKIKEVRGNIIIQLNQAEERKKENKKNEILAYYNSLDKSLEVPFEQVFNDEWLKESVNEKSWKSDIKLNYDMIVRNYNMIEKMDVSNKELLKDCFMETYNITLALDLYNDHIKVIKKEEERRKDAQEELKPIFEAKSLVKEDKHVVIMATIRGNESDWKKAKAYMESLNMIVEEI